MYNLIRIPENSLEHFLIAKNTHRWVNDASSVRRIDGEMDGKNDRIEINDFLLLHYTTSYASWRITLIFFLSKKNPYEGTRCVLSEL